ncbi:hypothetical protein GCM10027046_37420 [Uliginosibacterium flavum]
MTNAIDETNAGRNPEITVPAINYRPHKIRIETTRKLKVFTESLQPYAAKHFVLRSWMAIGFEVCVERIFVEKQSLYCRVH